MGGGDQGWLNCPLCDLYIELACKGCPVMGRTGQPYCDGSPYDKWQKAFARETVQFTNEVPHSLFTDEHYVIGPRTQAAAEAELAFLISLRK